MSDNDHNLTKKELEKMFHDYAKMRASILTDETHTGERATTHRRMANSLLTYAKEYSKEFLSKEFSFRN